MGAKSVLVAVVSVLMLGMAAGRADAAAPSCDRACLEGLASQVLAAMAAHDAKRLPLAANVRYTENNVELKLNDGLWITADSIDASKAWVTDAVSQQVVVYTGVKEWDQMAFLALRLKVRGGRISEIETSVSRKYWPAMGNYDAAALPAFDALWGQPVAADKKTSRAVMSKVASAYFDGIEQSNGKIVPFRGGECRRFENHLQTAGRRPANAPPGTGGAVAPDRPYETCEVQFSSGRFHYIPEVTDRRCDINDEVRGIAFCIVHFQHPGNIKTWTDKATGQVMPIGGNLAKYPNTTYIWEAFKVENGQYFDILAYVNVIPYRQASPW